MKNHKLKINLCILLFVVAMPLALHYGGSDYGLEEFIRIILARLQHQELSPNLETAELILFQIRLPRILVGAFIGFALATAGVFSQGLFRNPLASPAIIGTTSGGSTAAALMFYFGATHLHWLSLPIAAFIGCALSTSLILYFTHLKKLQSIETLLLAGFALNAILGAVTSLVISLVLEDHQKFPALLYWLMGGLNAKGWWHLGILLGPVCVGFLIAWKLSPQLDILSLGPQVAKTLNINVNKLKRISIISMALLVGAAVSVAGAISFVGLIVPHITRLLIGPANRRLLILSGINGMSLVVLADLAARSFWSPKEIQVGILIAIIGASFFFWLLLNIKQFNRGNE